MWTSRRIAWARTQLSPATSPDARTSKPRSMRFAASDSQVAAWASRNCRPAASSAMSIAADPETQTPKSVSLAFGYERVGRVVRNVLADWGVDSLAAMPAVSLRMSASKLWTRAFSAGAGNSG